MKGPIRQVPTFSEFTTLSEKKLQVYYYLLSCSRPNEFKDYDNRANGEIHGVKMVRTFKEDTGLMTQICNYKGRNGILDISLNSYKTAIKELKETWIEAKTKGGKTKKIRLLQPIEDGDQWTEFYIRPFYKDEFFFQWIQQDTLKDLALHSNNYLVLVYAHMLYLKYSKGKDWCLPHLTCALNICRLAFKVKRANKNKEQKISECFEILKGKGLIKYDLIKKNNRDFYRITEVNDHVKQNFTTIEQIGDEPASYVNEEKNMIKTNVQNAVDSLEKMCYEF